MLPTVAIVGRPNVGKSTLFNRVIGSRLAITDDEPGITRDRLYSKGEWLTRQFNVIDTGGIDFEDAPFVHEIKSQTEIAMEESDLIILVCDIRTGITDEDMFIARMLYKAKKPVVIALNKADDILLTDTMYEFYSLGLGDPIPVSSKHGVGIGDLLDRARAYMAESSVKNFQYFIDQRFTREEALMLTLNSKIALQEVLDSYSKKSK